MAPGLRRLRATGTALRRLSQMRAYFHCFTARKICPLQPGQISCQTCTATFQTASMQPKKLQRAGYTGASISDRRAKMVCKLASASATGQLLTIYCRSTIDDDRTYRRFLRRRFAAKDIDRN